MGFSLIVPILSRMVVEYFKYGRARLLAEPIFAAVGPFVAARQRTPGEPGFHPRQMRQWRSHMVKGKFRWEGWSVLENFLLEDQKSGIFIFSPRIPDSPVGEKK
jgi:hypothetical protein